MSRAMQLGELLSRSGRQSSARLSAWLGSQADPNTARASATRQQLAAARALRNLFASLFPIFIAEADEEALGRSCFGAARRAPIQARLAPRKMIAFRLRLERRLMNASA